MRQFVVKYRIELVSILLLLIFVFPYYLSRRYIITHRRPTVETIDRYPEPEYAPVLALGYDALLADFLFAKAQYYFGRHYVTDKTYPLLADMITVIMELNPTLDYPIKFADAAITSMGGTDSVETANELLQIGEELFPDEYYYPFQRGYNYYFYSGDYKKAYPIMYRAAKMESAPDNLFWLVSKVMTKGGGYRLGYEYTRMKYEKAKDEHMKECFGNRLTSFANLLALTRAVKCFRERTDREPRRNLRGLSTAGCIDSIPEEPYGGSYFYHRKSGTVQTTSDMYERDRKKNIKPESSDSLIEK